MWLFHCFQRYELSRMAPLLLNKLVSVLLVVGVLQLLLVTADPSEKRAAPARENSRLSNDQNNDVQRRKREYNPTNYAKKEDKLLLRFGKRSDGDLEDSDYLLREIRRPQDAMMRFGRARSDTMMRFGRGRSDNLMRFGRARADTLMRFGRSVWKTNVLWCKAANRRQFHQKPLWLTWFSCIVRTLLDGTVTSWFVAE